MKQLPLVLLLLLASCTSTPEPNRSPGSSYEHWTLREINNPPAHQRLEAKPGAAGLLEVLCQILRCLTPRW